MDAETLLQHGPFLRALARSLVADEATADDLVQEAWTAALVARGEIRTPRAWLAGAVRRLTRFRSRSEARRRQRERAVAQPEAQRGTADIVATEEARRTVVQAVLELDETYRTAILMRYYDGLEPREIAARLGVSSSTVRSRLQRGRASLRTRLGEKDRGWARALIPVAVGGVGGTAAAGVPGLWLGAAAALLLLAAGRIGWEALAEPAPPRSPQGLRARPASAGFRGKEVAASDAASGPGSAPTGETGTTNGNGTRRADDSETDPPSYPDDTLVAVFRLRDGSPLDEAETNARADVSGEVDVPPVNDGAFLVVAAGPAHRPVAWRSRTRGGRVELRRVEMEPGLTVAGRVTDGAGNAIARATVGVRRVDFAGRALSVPERAERFGWDGVAVTLLATTAETGDDGRFSVSGLDDELYEVWVESLVEAHDSVTERDGGYLYTTRVRAPTSDVAFRVARARIDVELVDPEGRPVTGATVRIGHPGGMTVYHCESDRLSLWFGPDTRHDIAVRRSGFQEAEVHATAPARGGSERLRVEMKPRRASATLVVAIEPASEASLPKQYGFRLEPVAGGPSITRTVAVRDGRCVLEDLDAGAYRLYARAEGLWLIRGGYLEDLTADVELAPALENRIVLRPRAAGRLGLDVTTHDGNTDVPLRVEAAGPRGERATWTFCKGDSGGYVSSTGKLPAAKGTAWVAQPILPGAYRLRLAHDDGTTVEREIVIVAGETTRAAVSLE